MNVVYFDTSTRLSACEDFIEFIYIYFFFATKASRHNNITPIRRTSYRRLGTDERSNAVSDIWGRRTYKYFHIVCLPDGKVFIYCDDMPRKFRLSYFRICFVPKQRGDVAETWGQRHKAQAILFSLKITQDHCTVLRDVTAPNPYVE